MTVVIAILVLPILTDYPLQSKHLFISHELQLIAVSVFTHASSVGRGCTNIAHDRNGASVKKMEASPTRTPSLSGGD
jgi:hypothetical protein